MNMNSNTETETEAQRKNKKSLPAKHNQLVVFSYWMLNQMKSDGKLSDEAFVECLEKFHVFHDVEIQKEYFDHYFEDFKLIQKSLKQEVREKNKKPKMKKAKIVDPNEPPKKRGRKKKVIHDNRSPEEILLDEIIRKCNEPQTEIKPDPEPEPEPKKRGRRRKVKRVVSSVGDDDIIQHLMAECERNDIETDEEDSEEEQEIEVRKIIIHDVTYLIDDDSNVYDVETHEALGVYDKNTLQIV